MIDTHCHIYTEEFDDDREAVVQRAVDAGIDKLLLPNINLHTMQPMLNIAARHRGLIYPMLGLHPEDVTQHWRLDLDTMLPLLQQPEHPFIAIGEVGLDFYWDTTFRVEQTEALREQVQWALRYSLPLMIHCRKAHREMVELLWPFREELSGVFHCFGGTAAEAEELLQFRRFALGIGGVVTYKKSTLPDTLRQTVPIGRIVLETDAPYLAPVPHRGKRNESSFLTYVAATLARIYDTTVDTIAQTTTNNALNIFTKAH